MKIAISGASGFIGVALTKYFKSLGETVVKISRDDLENESIKNLCDIIRECDVVINLNGASLNHLWSNSYKREIFYSRINTTRRLVEAINNTEHRPKLFMSTSAVGIYNNFGIHSENSKDYGQTFLSDVCLKWEHEAMNVTQDVRLVIMRFGVVMSEHGGVLPKMIRAAKYGIAPVIGNGNQPFAWIEINDLVRAVHFIIRNINIRGPVNFVSPSMISNKVLMNIIASEYDVKFNLRIPKWSVKMLLGDMSVLITDGQSVYPKVLSANKFLFSNSNLSVLIAGYK